MEPIYQFARILAVCLAAEGLARLIPLPIPASVYGLLLMLLALSLGVLKVRQVKQASDFLIRILPLLFLPAAVGVMALWSELRALLVPSLIAAVPVTLLVMVLSGRATQRLQTLAKRRRSDG